MHFSMNEHIFRYYEIAEFYLLNELFFVPHGQKAGKCEPVGVPVIDNGGGGTEEKLL